MRIKSKFTRIVDKEIIGQNRNSQLRQKYTCFPKRMIVRRIVYTLEDVKDDYVFGHIVYSPENEILDI